MYRFGLIVALTIVPSLCGSVLAQRAADRTPLLDSDATPVIGTEPFVPKTPRDEADDDRLVAASQFAAARLMLQRDDRAGALSRLQRAWRYDPEAGDIAREVIGLASALNRHEEAIRYAVIVGENYTSPPASLTQLGQLLVQRGQLSRGMRMYERAIEQRGDDQGLEALASRLELGRVAFRLDRHDDAAKSLAIVRDALETPGDFALSEQEHGKLLGQDGRVYALIGEVFLLAKRLDDAVPMFEKANESNPRDGLLAYNLARVATARDEHEAALEQLDKYFASKLDVAGTAPYNLLAELIGKVEDDEALARQRLLGKLSDLRDGDKENKPLALALAKRLAEDGQIEKAKPLFVDLAELAPSTTVYQQLAKICHEQSDVDRLLDLMTQAVERTESLQPLGEVVVRIAANKDFTSQLIEAARERAESAPEKLTRPGRVGVALLAVAADEHDAAMDFLDLALKSGGQSDLDVYETIGFAMFVADQLDKATAIFERAAKAGAETDDAAKFYDYMARVHAFAKDTDAALKAAEKAASLHPDVPQYQVRPAWVLYIGKQYDAAKERYLALLDRYDSRHDSDSVRDVMRSAKFNLSNICVATEEFAEAEEWLEQILDEFPEDIGAFNDLGYVWVDRGQHLNRAFGMIKRAVEAEPDNIAYRDSLGWAYYRLGKFEDSARELEKATAGENPDGVILDHLGDAYLKLDRTDDAVKTWRRAAEAHREAGDDAEVQLVEAKIAEHSG